MADGTIVLPWVTRSMTGKGLLFPVVPAPGETLPGYLLRNVQANHLESIRPLLDLANVKIGLSGNYLGKLADGASRLAGVIQLPEVEWAAIWGVAPEQGGRRRLGGVWLTAAQIDSNSRRVPRTYKSGDPDNAIWMVRNLGFCPRTWEMLVSKCPWRGCRRPLSWSSATAFDECSYCGQSVAEADRIVVPTSLRPTLRWLLNLFSDDEAVVIRAMAALPPTLEIDTPTDTYDLILAVARPLRVVVAPELCGRVSPELSDIVRACRFMLDFPRSHWDFAQLDPRVLNAFRSRLEILLKHPHRPAVRACLQRFLQYGRPAKAVAQASVSGRLPLSTTQAAAVLGIQRHDVRQLVEADLLFEAGYIGGPDRRHSAFLSHHVERLREELRAQMSLREFGARTGLPRAAAEQLLACGLLRVTTSAAAKLVFDGPHINRESGEQLIEMVLAKAAVTGAEDHIPLRGVMMGIGGRPKPWGRIIQALLSDGVPGGLVRVGDQRLVDLAVHPITARLLIMGGPGGGQTYAFQPGDLAGWERPDMAPSEAEEYLNCTAQDVGWLRAGAYLTPISQLGSLTRYCRREVEAVGRQLITTREIAARKGMLPIHVWPELKTFSKGGSLGQGFYERDQIEAWMGDL